MRLRSHLLFAILLVAGSAGARVVSYSPYTNRVAAPTTHERTTRYFALLESQSSSDWEERELVLYDTEGEEPRVVYPQNEDSADIAAAALYETPLPADGVSVSLLLIGYIDGQYRTLFSNDSGANWKQVTGIAGVPYWEMYDVDTGGPYTRGLANPIRVGNAQHPFVVSNQNGIWTIDANGTAKQISTRSGQLIGQNRAGTEFLISRPLTVWPFGNVLEMVSVGGGFNHLGNVPPGQYYGWIASDDSAYIAARRQDGRFLFRATPAGLQFILGPYDLGPEMTNVYRDPAWFIAVPTHDFNGAWMMQRQPGRPSALLRHTIAGGTVGMWSDVTGPEIEALIAGRSGETVLVQVHRDRSATMMRAFVDPALAVWRVGTPMPREYDELYLNEEDNKGFLHVDVDTLQAGSQFVFDSGSVQDGGGPIISPAPGGGGDVVQEWGVVRASLKQRLVLPGVARLPGAYGSFWMTDVTIFNPFEEAQDVELRFVPIAAETTSAVVRSTVVTLQPREIRYVPDALGSWFEIGEGGGAVHILPARGVNAFARTYSRKNEGTFGFGMMAIDFFNTTSARFPVTFAGAFPGANFRTNILLTDTSGKGTEARLGAFGLAGATGNDHTSIFAPAAGIMQFNGIGASMQVASQEQAGLSVEPTHGTAIATVVAIDNRTNDPTYFPPDVPATDSLVRAIPVIGHLDGANNSRFRSDLYLFNPSAFTLTVSLEAKKWDSPSSVVRQFTLLPRESRTIVDVLPTLFGYTGLARLRYWTNSWDEGVRVTSRTYTEEADGSTYGSLVPPLNAFQLAASGDALEIVGVAGGGNFRTNLAIVEMSPVNSFGATTVRVRVIDQTGRMIDTFTVPVPRAGGMQINDLFGARSVPVPNAALIVVEVLDEGLVTAYATLTDNVTNDTTFIGPNLAAK